MIDNKTLNPNNLPVIEENSLHRIVTTVKLYQEFKELGQQEFEKTYGKTDPKSLEGVCYKKYYKGKSENERFGLVKKYVGDETKNSPLEGWTAEQDGVVFLELGDYLKVELDDEKNVSEIQSQKLFFWKEWNFEEDIEREDCSRGVEKDENKKIIGNFVRDNINLPVDTIAVNSLSKPFVFYKYNILIGNDNNNLIINKVMHFSDVMSVEDGKVYFCNEETKFINIQFEKCDFHRSMFLGNLTFSGKNSKIGDYSSFNDCIFLKTVQFESVKFGNDIIFWYSKFLKKTKFYDVKFLGFIQFTNNEFYNVQFIECEFIGKVGFGGTLFVKMEKESKKVVENVENIELQELNNLHEMLKHSFWSKDIENKDLFDIYNCKFLDSVNFDSVKFSGSFGFYNLYFKNNASFTNLKINIDSKIIFSNFINETITIENQGVVLGEMFRDVTNLQFDIELAKSGGYCCYGLL